MRLILSLCAVLGACGGSGIPKIETTQFNPSLKVDLAHSTKTAHGVYYRDLVPGTGPVAAAGEVLNLNYAGYLSNGDLFDYNAGFQRPFFMKVGGTDAIPGFQEGLIGIRYGGTRQLIIPPDQAYGATQYGAIPANSILVFTVVALPTLSTSAYAPSLDVQIANSKFTQNGVAYRDLVAGTGPAVAAHQTLQVHYTGWLTDGTQFDTNGANATPFSFKLGEGRVIAGWDEGLAGATVGTTRQLVIPSWLAYADAGAGAIPPNSILVFTVQIVAAQ